METKITEIRYGSNWVATMEFNIGVGSDCRNPNPKPLKVPIGTILQWDEDSRDGNVWFNVEIDGEKYRGLTQSGNIVNVIKSGRISPYGNNEKGFIAYSGEYLQKLLNN
jgi:hypothetical protein